ncbi:Uncharacterised protein [Pseudomonas putida]|nr:Uncharacterised protein [Pseudomonas putida]CAB5576445.1 Uncharacterised protein [Pseudomonas putida]CAB5621761.1 Uncharacterised protein [Pseudomonas putida]CAB5623404.1 Uncharacterised protein [Pseudomonas putida]CAB5700678.1 Uncharacterised protein [Pseudomonas putida]
MMIGSRIIAPEGFKCLNKGAVYHFLLSDGLKNRVRLVFFYKGKKQLIAQLISLNRIEFEQALEDGLLVEEHPDKYPPWLSNIQGVSIQYLEEHRRSAKETYDQKVNRRYIAIAELVKRAQRILAADNPSKEIGVYAKSQTPKQNPTRLRLWFYIYIVFGRNKWALLPPTDEIGKWSREDRACTQKLGRPSHRGKRSGFHADRLMHEKMLKSFLRETSPFKTQNRIYSDVLVKYYGCVAIAKNRGGHEFIQPQMQPFPTPRQFWYSIKKQMGSGELALALKGRNGSRASSGSQGDFAELLTNVNQVVEFDGYHFSEHPAGMLEGSAQEKYCVVRSVCGLTGAITGIGFSEGRETMQAYRMALFCMAINKVKFFDLFGFKLGPEDWTCEGLSGDIVVDRGPGSTYDCLPQIKWLGTFELTPTFEGQSKATVESSHPRDKNPAEQPSHFHSDKNFISLARRELWQVIWDNQSSDAKNRLNEDMVLAGVRPTPQGVWDYWDARGRNSSISMEFETAVRTFLTPTPVTITKDAVYLHKRKYRSAALMETGIFDRVARQGVIQTTAYVLTMCVRRIWVEVQGVLYELEVVRSAKTVEGTVDLTLRELLEVGQMRRDSEASLREEIPATQQFQRDRFEQATGESWDGGVRRLGRAPKNAAAKRDKADAARFTGKAR